ncbi:MAG: hypothetical protein ACLQQ4_12600 [Bacteroidia bacterium]
MMKTINISGCQYTYDDGMYLVVIMSFLEKSYKEGHYYSNGFFHKSVACAKKLLLHCRLEMGFIIQKVCPGIVYRDKRDIHYKESGLYDGDRVIYTVGSRQFNHIWYSGYIKTIDEEINLMREFGMQHVQALMELLVRKDLAERLHLIKMTEGLPRCHYALLHCDPEYDIYENEYWQCRKDIEPLNMPRYYNN